MRKEKPPAPLKPADPVRAQKRAKRKAGTLRVLRVVLWVMLVFVFVRGVLAIVLPDDEISAREELAAYQKQHEAAEEQLRGLLPFAEDFAREYLTFSAGGEENYKTRLSAYAAPSVYRDLTLGSGSASIQRATGYRAEAVSDSQFNVRVRATVRYVRNAQNQTTKETTEKVTVDRIILIVPVAVVDGAYIVNDTPIFAAEPGLPELPAASYTGTPAPGETTAQITQALTNFYTAYYKEDESVIAYYLDADADPDSFVGLHGKVAFSQVSDCKAYQMEGGYLVLATVEVVTPSGQTLPQRFSLCVTARDGQFYVHSMDTRPSNLNQ